MLKKWISLAGIALAAALFVTGCRCADDDLPLTGTEWVLDLSSLRQVPPSAEQPSQAITLVITPEGKFSGCAGVNRYFGTVGIDFEEEEIRFGMPGTTRMAGPGMNYEQAYLRMLRDVREYDIDERTLKLSGRDDDTILAVFRGRKAAVPAAGTEK